MGETTEWIRCEDRLPDIEEEWEDIEDVWVAGKHGDYGQYVTIGRRVVITADDGGWEWWDSYNHSIEGEPVTLYGVTHWMPFVMPEPPEEERDGG